MRLEVRDASCGHDKKHPTLTHVSFEVESGQVCCVLGPNGVGKSTLFQSVLGLLPLLSGQVLIDGQDVARWSPARMAGQIAYVSQSHKPPFPYQVKDVVMMGRTALMGPTGTPRLEDWNAVDNALEDLGITHLRDKAYTDISGGELQMVMIARALAQKPRMLVLDEPTAALDYGNVVRVIGKVRELAAKGYAVVMTTHSPDHAFMCNSKVLLLQRDAPQVFGDAVNVITERNMRSAYGIGVRVVEFLNPGDTVVRMCAPVFSDPLAAGDAGASEEAGEQ
ncbi:MAG: ABC transporter ATP-binding protein [Coriobacteriia bacterium]|nr:ABC transporter ATP-binding protein [Coriobacteriia bacterium]MBS5477983.1 ABC transporter ATP-binding protein [Coriobacteriia bacterium]